MSHNRLFGDAPALPYSSYAAGGCDLTDNLLSCPLPAGADGCHPPGAAPPTCAPTSPQVSPLCGLALGQLYGNPAVVNATTAFYAAMAGVYQDLGNVCGTELQVNGTCHFPLDWNATKGGRTLLALQGAIHAANPKAELCLIDSDTHTSCGTLGPCEILITESGLAPMPHACTAADRQAWLDFSTSPAQCVKSGATSCADQRGATRRPAARRRTRSRPPREPIRVSARLRAAAVKITSCEIASGRDDAFTFTRSRAARARRR